MISNHLDLEYIESKTINNTIEDEMTSDEIDLEEEVILVYQLRPTSLRYPLNTIICVFLNSIILID